jgi:DNA-binding PadR family transcriptional regulator
MVEIGKFRALVTKDLEELSYAGNRSHFQADLANLRRQDLITLRQLPQKDAPPRRLVALTKEGRRLLLVHERVPKNQAIYYGFSKLREADHDADLYRLYQKALDEIGQKGGKETRVILDSELKRILYRDLARVKRGRNSPDFAAIAERHGLKLIRSTIPVPDLRVEYETEDRAQARVDLELATEHYRFKNLAKKASAGFSMYARPEEVSKLRRVMDERELIAEIMSL